MISRKLQISLRVLAMLGSVMAVLSSYQPLTFASSKQCVANTSRAYATATVRAQGTPLPVPKKAEYWAAMIEWGGYLKTWLQNNQKSGDGPFNERLAQVYYDMELCAYRLADHTGDTRAWHELADLAEKVYRDEYVLPERLPDGSSKPPGGVSGYRMFTEGLVEDFLRSGDEESKRAAQLILEKGAYSAANPGEDVSQTNYSREVAYALMNHVQIPRLSGVTLTPAQLERRSRLLEYSLRHIDRWSISRTAEYFRPFMGALTARALIEYYLRVSPDPSIIPKLKALADYMWDSCWVSSANSFTYTDRELPLGHPDKDPDTADRASHPDLNMLIAPLFGFLWWQTGEAKWRQRGDLVWEGGIPVYSTENACSGNGCPISGANLGTRGPNNPSGKRYDQQLFWAPLYIKWAESAPVGTSVPPPNQPPQVSISATPASGIAPLEVRFQANIVSSGSSARCYGWDFGDGQTSPETSPAHIYRAPGTYPVRLTVIDSTGAVASASTTITVAPSFVREAVRWTKLVGGTASRGTLSRTPNYTGLFAGASSAQLIKASGGYVEFTATGSPAERYCGLSYGDSDQSPPDIDFALKLGSGRDFYVIEFGGQPRYIADYTDGDVFRIAVASGAIKFYRNGALFYTSAVSPRFPLLVDASLGWGPSSIANAYIYYQP